MELKSWRKVYWWLWGLCHYLYCCFCVTYYPVNRTHWCSYHPQPAQFPHDDQGENISKTGKYLCCGEKTYRFEIFPSSNGCQFRSHSPKMDGLSESILSILKKQESLICVPLPKIGLYHEIIRITKVKEDKESLKVASTNGINQHRFFNIEILSKRTTENLLGINCYDEECTDCSNSDKNESQDMDSPKNKLQNLYDEFIHEYSPINIDNSSQSDEEDITDESIQTKGRFTKISNSDGSKICWPRKEVYAERWIPKLPVRFNQDNLRDREERLVANFIKTLTKKGNELNHIPVKFHPNVQHIGRHSWANFRNNIHD